MLKFCIKRKENKLLKEKRKEEKKFLIKKSVSIVTRKRKGNKI